MAKLHLQREETALKIRAVKLPLAALEGLGTVREVGFFLPVADTFSAHVFIPIFAPTSEENMVAQVPMHQHTTGLVIRPSLSPLQILYSSVPPICRKREH